jgi:hypothetical protein
MDILKTLDQHITAALKGGMKDRLEALRVLKAGLQKLKIDKGGLTEADAVNQLMAEAKRRREAIELYEKGGREDLRKKEENELDIINEFLPAQLSDQEVEEMVTRVIAEVGAQSSKDIGKVMSAVMARARGQVDGKKVQEIVRHKLS